VGEVKNNMPKIKLKLKKNKVYEMYARDIKSQLREKIEQQKLKRQIKAHNVDDAYDEAIDDVLKIIENL
jgi:predicted nucleic acid-binding protein